MLVLLLYVEQPLFFEHFFLQKVEEVWILLRYQKLHQFQEHQTELYLLLFYQSFLLDLYLIHF
ncbi:MAG: hypothetical protein CMF74_07560 [Maricaulis sp.]|nr:hypothetical protein [Maricaulis sp.]